MHTINSFINDKAVTRGGINLFSKDNAVKFIKLCEKYKISILGIDGFYLEADKTIPSIENSVDFTRTSLGLEETFKIAKEHVNKQNESLYFEIVYSDK